MKWLIFALAAMAMFTLANIVLKKMVNEIGAVDWDNIRVVLQNRTFNFSVLILLLVFFTSAGFVSMVKALEEGKVALVMAVVSLSTVFLAVLSIFIFGDVFSPKEIVAMAFAIVAILILVI